MKTSPLIIFLYIFTFLFASCEEKKQIVIAKTDNTLEIKRLIKKADQQFDDFQDDSAVYNFNKAIALCIPREAYADEFVYSKTIIANILQNVGDYYGSEAQLTQTIPYLEKTSKPKFIYNVYTIMAYNYSHNYDYKNALVYHKKALSLAQTPFKKSVLTADIAILYLNQNKFKEAIQLLEPLVAKKAKHETDSIKTINHYSLLLNNLGFCYAKTRNPKALKCLEESLALTLTLNDDYELIGSYNTLYFYHNENKNFKLAKMYAEKAYECSVKAKAPILRVNCIANLMKLSSGKKLKGYSQLYIHLIDSINDSRKTSKNEFSHIKYNFEKDKEENVELKSYRAEKDLQLEIQKNRSFILYIAIFLILFLLVFLVLHIHQKGKRERNHTIFKSEMRISRLLQSELSKKVQDILLFSKSSDLQNEDNKEKLLSNLNEIYNKTRKISKENSVIVTDENYVSGLKEMISDYSTANLNIIINGLNTYSWTKIHRNKKITVYRILQELLENIQKNRTSLISINFKKSEKNIQIIFVANDSEIRHQQINLKKILQNVENRIKTINGTINFESNLENGFKISFTFPI